MGVVFMSEVSEGGEGGLEECNVRCLLRVFGL